MELNINTFQELQAEHQNLLAQQDKVGSPAEEQELFQKVQLYFVRVGREGHRVKSSHEKEQLEVYILYWADYLRENHSKYPRSVSAPAFKLAADRTNQPRIPRIFLVLVIVLMLLAMLLWAATNYFITSNMAKPSATAETSVVETRAAVIPGILTRNSEIEATNEFVTQTVEALLTAGTLVISTPTPPSITTPTPAATNSP